MAEKQETPILIYKHFTMYPTQRKVFVNEQDTYLTCMEFDLFHLFLKNQGGVLDYE